MSSSSQKAFQCLFSITLLVCLMAAALCPKPCKGATAAAEASAAPAVPAAAGGGADPPPVILVKFSTNISEVVNGVPFIAKCEIENFTPVGTYQVRFDRNSGSLASYDYKTPDANGKQPPEIFFIDVKNVDIQASAGEAKDLKNGFEVKLTPISVKADDYSCVLIIGAADGHQEVHASEKWHSSGAAPLSTVMTLVTLGASLMVAVKFQ